MAKIYKRKAVVIKQDPQKEAPQGTHLKMVKRFTSRLPFSFTIFFTDENGMSVKYGQFVKAQEEY